MARHDQPAELLANITSLRLALLIAAFTIGTILALVLPSLQNLVLPFIVIAFGLSFQSFSQLLMGVYQHRQTIWRATVGDLIGRLAQIAVILSIGALAATTTNLVVAFSASTLVALLIHRALLPNLKWRLSFVRPVWRRLLVTSWPLGAMLVLNAIYFRIDLLILAQFRPAREVGLYGIAYRIIESALFLPAMFGGLLLPHLSRAAAKRNYQLIRQYLSQSLHVLPLLAALTVSIIFSESRSILILISGSDYAAASPLLQLLSFALAIMFLGNLFGFTLVALNRQMYLLKLYAGLALVNLVANFIFIPAYGALAAATTTIITEFLAMSLAAYAVIKLTKLSLPYGYLLKLVIPTLATAGLALLIAPTLPLVARLIIEVIFFLSLAVSLRLVNRNHLSILLTRANP